MSLAAEKGYEAVVKLLLKMGVEVDSKDNDARTPLWWAAGKGYEAVVKLLASKVPRDIDSCAHVTSALYKWGWQITCNFDYNTNIVICKRSSVPCLQYSQTFVILAPQKLFRIVSDGPEALHLRCYTLCVSL